MSEISNILAVLPAAAAPAAPGESDSPGVDGFAFDLPGEDAAPEAAAPPSEDALEEWLAARSGVTAQLAEVEAAPGEARVAGTPLPGVDLPPEPGADPADVAEVDGRSSAERVEVEPAVPMAISPTRHETGDDGGAAMPGIAPTGIPAPQVAEHPAGGEPGRLPEDAVAPLPTRSQEADQGVGNGEASPAPQVSAEAGRPAYGTQANHALQHAPEATLAPAPSAGHVVGADRKVSSPSSGPLAAAAADAPRAVEESSPAQAARPVADPSAAAARPGSVPLPSGFEATQIPAFAPAEASPLLAAPPLGDREIRLPLPLTATHPSAHAPSPGRQIAEAVLVSRGETTEILLAPEELGRLRMVVTGGDRSQLVIWAERPETLELLRRNADLLSADLAEAGLGSASMEFRQGGEWQASVRFAPPATGDADITVVPPLAAARRYIDPHRRIDIRV